jgi:putative phosphoesterase
MRILLLADIHGNREALEAVDEPFDVCLFLGDLVDYGPEPGPCVEWVRRHARYSVRGNHDHGVAQNVEVQGVAGFRYLTSMTRPPTVAALMHEQRRFLAEMPTTRMCTFNGKRFLLVHATPRDPMDEYAPADPDFWGPRVAGLEVDYVCVGHTHQPFTLEVSGVTIINPGSVGLPRDGDPRAAYAIIEGFDVQLKRAEYAVERTIRSVQDSGIPQMAKQLLTEVYRGGAHLIRPGMNGHNGVNGHNGRHEAEKENA